MAVLSPRFETQPLFAIHREKLFLINGQWVAMEASIEIAVQFDEQIQRIPIGVQRNQLFAQQLRSSNSVTSLVGSTDAEKRWFSWNLRKLLVAGLREPCPNTFSNSF